MASGTPEEVVAANLAAYNAKDVAAFGATYAADAKFCKIDGTVLLTGRDAIAAFHQRFFEGNPSAHCVILQHVAMGAFVVDQQQISVEGRPPMNVMLVSEVRDGLIVRASYSPL
jgi:putative hydrolase of HD superfamily